MKLILFQSPRIYKYRLLSVSSIYQGIPILHQPVIILGDGSIYFGSNSSFGVWNSPGFFNGVSYIEARSKSAVINIGKNIIANNNFTVICVETSIEIGNDCLIGYNVAIYDSDFHDINPDMRRSGHGLADDVKIGDNVFIGSNVTILKGVTIGNNAVIASGSIVTKSFPENIIIGGVPAKEIGSVH